MMMQFQTTSNKAYGVNLEKYRCANVVVKLLARMKDGTTFHNTSTARPSGHEYSQMNVAVFADESSENRDCSVGELKNFEQAFFDLLDTYTDENLSYVEVQVSCLDNAHRRTTLRACAAASRDECSKDAMKEAYKKAAMIRKQYLAYTPKQQRGAERDWS